ncbi:MAG: MATE family efflux transporter [Maricaulaceae bacterium]
MTDIQTAPVGQIPPEDISSFRAELWALFKLGWPMALAQLAQMSIYTIDVIMIGRLGPYDLAAASLGLIVYFAMWMLGFGPAMAVSPMVSQALGANKTNYRDARRSVRAALWLVIFFTPFVFLVSWNADHVLIAFGQDQELAQKAGHYVKAVMLGWPFALGIMVLRNYLAVLGKTTVPLVLVLIAIALNALLNWLFIFGALGFPAWGLVGAGIASTIATIISFLTFMAYVYRDKTSRPFQIFTNFHKLDPARLKEVFALGWPISITTFFEGMLFNACILIVGLIGALEVAAYHIALNVSSLAFMLPWGFAMAGAARMGLAVGAGSKPAVQRVSKATFVLAICSISLIGIPVAIWPEAVAAIYITEHVNDAAAVMALVVSFLPIAVGFMLFDATQVAANQLLRGMKDVRWPMMLTCISYWVVGFSAAYYFGLHTELGAKGVWYGLLLGLVCSAILLSLRLRWMFKTYNEAS